MRLRWWRGPTHAPDDAAAAQEAIAGLRKQKASLDKYDSHADANGWADMQQFVRNMNGMSG